MKAQPVLPIIWMQVLDDVAETLHTTKAAAAQREQAMSAVSVAWDAEERRRSCEQQSRQRLEEQLKGWPAALAQAEKEASAADAVLQAGEAALGRWLNGWETLERRLAKWANHEV